MVENGRHRKAKSEKYKLFEEPVFTGIGKDILAYDNVTQCLDEVRSTTDFTLLSLDRQTIVLVVSS